MAMYLSIKSNEYDTLKALRELLKYGKNAFYASQEAASYATDPATKLSIEKIRNTLRDVVNLSDTLSRDLIKASARKEEPLDRNASASPRLQPWVERADAEAAL
jgi:hypothetical protein